VVEHDLVYATRVGPAYLDPGSGSLLLQMLAGGVAAVAVAGKFYWRRFLRAIGIRKRDDGER
jgi:hypothetical protein